MYIAHGGGKRCEFPRVATTVLRDQHCVAEHTEEGSDVDVLMVVPTVQELSIAHGVGKRCCYHDDCGKSATSSALLCKAYIEGK
jgi:hypothetical protein